MADSDNNPSWGKVKVYEQMLRGVREKAASWEDKFQAALDDLRGLQHNACVESEIKTQLAEEEVKQAMEHLQKCQDNLDAKKAANKETVEHFQKCRDDMIAMKIRSIEKVFAEEERRRKMLSQAFARIQAWRERIVEARQEQMTRDASSTGEAA
ncbi:hypothetical protein LA080_001560 [Diaporthe eres]|nr:hypothetical protein LA080_001560 [Diaporthe eres]